MTVIRSSIHSKDGDEFAPISAGLKADLGISQRQVQGMRAEAARRREAQRIIDAVDRHAELARLTRRFNHQSDRFPPWWLALVPVAGGLLVVALATAGWWL